MYITGSHTNLSIKMKIAHLADLHLLITTIDYIPARRYPIMCYPDRCVQIGVLIKDIVH